MANLRVDVGADLDNDVSFGPGARVGVFAGGTDARWRTHLFGEITRFAAGDTTTWIRGGTAVRYATSRNTGLTVEGNVIRSYGETWFEGGLRLSFYL